jgi:hypothetical protein
VLLLEQQQQIPLQWQLLLPLLPLMLLIPFSLERATPL